MPFPTPLDEFRDNRNQLRLILSRFSGIPSRATWNLPPNPTAVFQRRPEEKIDIGVSNFRLLLRRI